MSLMSTLREKLGFAPPAAPERPCDCRLRKAEVELQEANAELKQGKAIYAASARLVERTAANQAHSANVTRYLLEGMLNRLRGEARDRDAQNHVP